MKKILHILSIQQFTSSEVLKIFHQTCQMEKNAQRSVNLRSKSKGIVLLFYQPSTRTRASFELASHFLGYRILYSTEAAEFFSSAAKGESLEDTIELFSNYPGVKVIILRHPEKGSADRAAKIAGPYGISIINAGDGANEHPTQALLDLYTIYKLRLNQKPMKQIKLVVANDIEHSRTIRSLCLLFAKIFRPLEIGVSAPKNINLAKDIQNGLKDSGVKIIKFNDLKTAALWADFLYMTRPQIEYYRSKKLAKKFQHFRISKDFLDSIPQNYPCQILHPMPIDSKNFNEITDEARHHPRCQIFQQARNGIYIRMALLKMLLK
ncbi:MAG: hypothetical protein HW405_18 [Candidatus Berkelbacteria bacterium]|nr:hypothetical protein [Candidatus Berkelbacteria bacterium]